MQGAAAWHSQSVDELTEHVLAFDLFLSMLQRFCVNSGSVGFCLQSLLQALIGFVLFFSCSCNVTARSVRMSYRVKVRKRCLMILLHYFNICSA